ncbi:hypothetical protein B0H13DRAFT_1898078 [Mycena leptocephala]|nr:hypothetical protein B0H13DRAFT_1898078 [Mycena leptocephala]
MSTLQRMLLISDETGEITAYKDANVLGKFSAPKSQPQSREVGTCVAVSAAQSVTGCNLVLRPMRRGRQAPETSSPIHLRDPAQITCNVQTVKGDSCWINANGTYTLTHTSGMVQSTSYSVTTANEIGFGAEISASIEIPETADLDTSYHTDVTFTNTQDSSTSSMDSTSTSSPAVNIAMQSCYTTGTATLRTTVSGYVWFNYDSAVNTFLATIFRLPEYRSISTGFRLRIRVGI